MGFAITVAQFFLPGHFPYPAYQILQDPEGTDRTAVDAAEQAGQEEDRNETGRNESESGKKPYNRGHEL